MTISIVTDSEPDFERAAELYRHLPLPYPLPDGKYTPGEIEAIASLYSASYINLMDAKHDKAARKIKGRRRGDPRRTRQNMAGLRALIYHLAEAERPVTIRQMFYRLSSYGVIGKMQSEYSGTVDRLMLEMRRSGDLPYEWVSDNTRWVRKPRTFTGLRQMLVETRNTYRRDLWAQADIYVEVWCEKDALAGVIMDVTDPYAVPLMVARGFSSDTFCFNAAENIRDQGKPAYIYLLGDHDPSGQDALKSTERKLTKFVGGVVPVHFEVLGVTPEQIRDWKLPDRPPKPGSRARKFRGPWVDLDAIPSPQLRDLVRGAIERHLDAQEFARLLAIEEQEKATLDTILAALPGYDGGRPRRR